MYQSVDIPRTAWWVFLKLRSGTWTQAIDSPLNWVHFIGAARSHYLRLVLVIQITNPVTITRKKLVLYEEENSRPCSLHRWVDRYFRYRNNIIDRHGTNLLDNDASAWIILMCYFTDHCSSITDRWSVVADHCVYSQGRVSLVVGQILFHLLAIKCWSFYLSLRWWYLVDGYHLLLNCKDYVELNERRSSYRSTWPMMLRNLAIEFLAL